MPSLSFDICPDCGAAVNPTHYHYCPEKKEAKEKLWKLMQEKVMKEADKSVKKPQGGIKVSNSSSYGDSIYASSTYTMLTDNAWGSKWATGYADTYPKETSQQKYMCGQCNFTSTESIDVAKHIHSVHSKPAYATYETDPYKPTYPKPPEQKKCYVCSAMLPDSMYDGHMQMHWSQKADATMFSMAQQKINALAAQVSDLLNIVNKLQEEVKNIDKPVVKSLF